MKGREEGGERQRKIIRRKQRSRERLTGLSLKDSSRCPFKVQNKTTHRKEAGREKTAKSRHSKGECMNEAVLHPLFKREKLFDKIPQISCNV